MSLDFRLFAAAALVAASTSVAAQPDERVVRSRSVSGWRIVDINESDGGNVVRMSRQRGDARVERHVSVWRGGPGGGASVTVGGCYGSDDQTINDISDPRSAATLRRQLLGYLGACGVSGARATALLAGFERAYAIYRRWVDENAAEAAAEAEAIANYGRDSPRR